MADEIWRILSPSKADSLTAAEHKNDPANPTLRAILFSRDFVPTYYYCLAILVLAAALLHFNKRSLRRTIPTEKSTSDSSSVHSSSATTLQGDASPLAGKAREEQTPLLATDYKAENGGMSTSLTVWRHLRSFLLYQPRPFPALTSPSNQPPSNATTLMILVLLAINIFYLFYKSVPSISNATAVADRAGLCFVANLPVLYLLGAKNSKPLKWLTGWSYEGLNIVHRRLGEWMIILACVHAVGMMMLWYNTFRPLGYTLGHFLSLKIIAIGLAALIAYLLIYISSIGYIRRATYELFLASHIFLQIAALVLLFLHHHNTRLYCGAAIAIWAFDRLITRIWVSWKPFVATLQIVPEDDTILLFCDIPITSSRSGGIRSGWRPGQHVFLSVPEIGWTHRYQSHPFTIASPAPPSHVKSGTWPMQLIIRSRDGFSRDLFRYAEFHQHTNVIIDGPYGSSDYLEALQRSDRTCLIAGGSGISVTYPLSWALQVDDDVDSILSTRTTYKSGQKHIPQTSVAAVPTNEQQHVHFWIRQEDKHKQWITMLPRRQAMLGRTMLDPRSDEDTEAASIINHTFVTRDVSGGRPDIELEISEWVRRKPVLLAGRERICIVVSGPDQLAREVRNCASRLSREYNVEVFVEKFGW